MRGGGRGSKGRGLLQTEQRDPPAPMQWPSCLRAPEYSYKTAQLDREVKWPFVTQTELWSFVTQKEFALDSQAGTLSGEEDREALGLP